MHVGLNPEMQRFIEDKVRSGQYATPDDVINGALAVLKAQEIETTEDLDELRSLIAIGLAQLDRGEGKEWDPEDLKRRVRERAARKTKAG